MDRDKLESLKDYLRKGNRHALSRELSRLSAKRIHRRFAADVASVARRGGFPWLSLEILNAIVRPKGSLRDDPTDKENIEYAASLIKLGSTTEALRLLAGCALPEARLFSAFAQISQWDYGSATHSLEGFLGSVEKGGESEQLGLLNLVACFLYVGRLEEAGALLGDLIVRLKGKEQMRLLSIAFELGSQLQIEFRNFSKARDMLVAGRKLIVDPTGPEGILLDKWSLYCDLYEGNDFEAHVWRWRSLRRRARACGQWETLRDLDFARAVTTKDKSLAIHLYYGTPFQSFRERLFRYFTEPLQIPSSYDFSSGPRSREVYYLFDVSQDPHLDPKHMMTRLARALFSDFYRPASIGSLFQTLFPGEFFNPGSSRSRIQQTVSSLRSWMRKKQVNLDIVHELSAYWWDTKKCAVNLPQKLDELGEVSLQGLLLFGDSPFTQRDVIKKLATRRELARELLRKGVEQGFLTREGAGPHTAYRVVKRSVKVA